MPKVLRFLENLNRYARTRWNHEKLTDRFSGQNKTRRKYHRHSLRGLEGSFLRINGEIYPLLNISYGGTSIFSDKPIFTELYRNKTEVKGTLSVLGISCEARFTVVYIDNVLVGISFLESDEVVQKFLEKTLYHLDCGIVLKRLSRNSVSHFFQGPAWNSYGNENITTEVHIAFGQNSDLQEVNVSYVDGFRREYVVFTPKATTVATVPEKRLKINEKKLILRNAILIIVGFRQIANSEHFDKLIESAIGLLKKQSAKK